MKHQCYLAPIFLVLYFFFFFLIFLIISGCSYSITMVHTQGEAQDVVDEQQTPTADIKATIPLN